MIHALFIAFLIMVLFLMYKNDNVMINKTIEQIKQESFHSKSKKFTYNKNRSQPLILKKEQENNLLTEESTGIDRSKFKNIEELEYLGEIESRPSPYNKVSTLTNSENKILENEEPYLRGLLNMNQYYR
jgi:hypothetical protein